MEGLQSQEAQGAIHLSKSPIKKPPDWVVLFCIFSGDYSPIASINAFEIRL